MPLNSLNRTRTLPDDADGLRANRNPLIEQASILRKSYFYTNLPYGPVKRYVATIARVHIDAGLGGRVPVTGDREMAKAVDWTCGD
jgi:hypothetical protein